MFLKLIKHSSTHAFTHRGHRGLVPIHSSLGVKSRAQPGHSLQGNRDTQPCAQSPLRTTCMEKTFRNHADRPLARNQNQQLVLQGNIVTSCTIVPYVNHL